MEPTKESYLKIISEADIVYLNNQEMASALMELVKNTSGIHASDNRMLVKQLLEREKQGSTIIAPKVALAHTKTEVVDNLILSFGFSKGGKLKWAFEGKEEVKIVILLLFPIKGDRCSDFEIIKDLMIKLANQEQMDQMIKLTNAQDIKKILIGK